MGEAVVIAALALALAGFALVLAGAFRHSRVLLAAGCAILLALAGGWVFGLPGLAAGLIGLALLKGKEAR